MHTIRFDESELEEILQALFGEDLYDEGEALCLDILDAVDPESRSARLFLLLNLVAQDAQAEAIAMLGELSDPMLVEALERLTNLGVTKTGTKVCKAIRKKRLLPVNLPSDEPHQGAPWLPLQFPLVSEKARRRVGRQVRKTRPACVPKVTE